MSEEQWNEIRPGVEVSSLGRVRMYLECCLDSDGYPQLPPGQRGGKAEKVHHLVAEAFVGPRPEGQIVRHLNDIPTDNRLENLAYGTRKDNAADAARNGRIHWTQVPENRGRLLAAARLGGLSWRGQKRDGLRGKRIAA